MEPEESEFSWTALFVITSASFIVFNAAIKFLDGDFSPLLFAISGVAALLAIMNTIVKSVMSQHKK